MEKIKRPNRISSKTPRIKTGCGTLYITVGEDQGRIIEVISASLGKTGGCATSMLEAITRSVTIGLRYGIPLDEYVKALSNIQCPNTIWDKDTQVRSCPDAMSKVLGEVSRVKEDGV